MIYETSKLTFSGGTSNMTPAIYNFLSIFTNRFALDGNWLIFDDSVKFRINGNNVYPYPQVICHDQNQTTLSLSDWGRWNRPSSTTAGYTTFLLSNNVFYLTVYQDGDYNCRGEIIIFKGKDNNWFFGSAYQSFNANSADYYNVETTLGPYILANMLRFSVTSDKILWCDTCPISYEGTYTSYTEELKNCSNVTQGKVITISGQNYFTLGTNVLVPINI